MKFLDAANFLLQIEINELVNKINSLIKQLEDFQSDIYYVNIGLDIKGKNDSGS